MKKFAKIAGIVLLSFVGLLIIVFLIVRFVFRDQTVLALRGAQQAEHVELLRGAGPYTADTVQYSFTYKQDTLRAREIRNYFRLDTLLSADATTWDNTLALAKFIAGNVPHANQSTYPKENNAVALWEYHLDTEPGFNCRLHSIMLHELLLASGITNRFVTCLPGDLEDTECHVVNIVWLPEQQKWAMIDSDMQAYLTDPAGTVLSLGEMRARYIDEKPIVVHWLLSDQDSNDYLTYWAKNLFWFACWEQTGYDKEPSAWKDACIVYLVPQGFETPEMDNPVITTTDETRFWAPPTR